MIAYNWTSLDNLIIRKQAEEAFDAGCISKEEDTKIGAAYPVDFYTSNIFICIGLFLLTIVIAVFSLGLFFLITAGGGGSIVPLLIFSFVVCYIALEYTVRKRLHFRSGVDYALLWTSAALLNAAIFMSVDNMPTVSLCITIFIISLLFMLRFANNIMALVTYAALLALIINIAALTGGTAQLITPFTIMAVSLAGWLLSARFHNYERCRHYRQCLTAIKVATLASFYLAGNYYIVRELGNYMFGLSQPAGDSISMGWFFWMLTVATPLFYVYLAIRKKDTILLWTGLTLIAATVFTIRYYYHVLPVEWAMILGGIVIIAAAYALTKYLKMPKHGFTSLESNNKHLLEKLQIESLVIAETFAAPSAVPAPTNDFQFGGGSGGGGGAGGQY